MRTPLFLAFLFFVGSIALPVGLYAQPEGPPPGQFEALLETVSEATTTHDGQGMSIGHLAPNASRLAFHTLARQERFLQVDVIESYWADATLSGRAFLAALLLLVDETAGEAAIALLEAETGTVGAGTGCYHRSVSPAGAARWLFEDEDRERRLREERRRRREERRREPEEPDSGT